MYLSILIFTLYFLSAGASAQGELSDISCKKSPKATDEVYVGNHIENLAAKKQASINQVGSIAELGNLPVWVDESVDSNKPSVYSELFWEVTPKGEYIYFLAGDYLKNEKGLLRYGTIPPKTTIFAEVNFENDVIKAATRDSTKEQEIADRDVKAILYLKTLTLNQLLNIFQVSTHPFDKRVGIASLKKVLDDGQTGFSRMVIYKDNGFGYIKLIHEEFRDNTSKNQSPRYLKIELSSKDMNLKIESLINQYSDLVQKYSGMPYVCLSGTTRG